MKRLLFAAALLLPLLGCTVRGVVIAPSCEPNQRLAIVAQAVPTATAVPCVDRLPAGWSAGGVSVRSGNATFWLDSDRAGDHAVKVVLTRTCDTSNAEPAASTDTGSGRFERSTVVGGRVKRTVYDVFEGGCVTSSLDLPHASAEALAEEANDAVGFFTRERLRRELHDRSGVDIGPAAS